VVFLLNPTPLAADVLAMTQPWQRHPLRSILRAIVSVGAVAIGAKIYISVLPHSPALGAFAVIGTGAVLVLAFIDVDRHLDEPVQEESEQSS
jgi:ABC-type tungstate transport system substrate-binding protein